MNKKQIKINVEEVCRDQELNPQTVNFLTDLFALQQKYPECYVEAWTADDYQTTIKDKLTKGQNEIITNMLYNTCDANKGTTWKKVRACVEDTVENY